MDKGGISRTILSAGVTSKRGILSPKELVSLANNHSGRIILAVRTKGGAYVRNEKSYYDLLNMQMATEQYGAMAEVLVYHAQKSGHSRKAPEIVVYPDDKRVQTALNYSLEKKWPFVIHIEFAAAGTRYDEFMTKLEETLSLYPEHPFVLIHMGQLTHSAVSQLIEKYPNIYFITSHSNPVTLRRYRQHWTNLFQGNNLSADWEQLIITYPDRFILGFDMVWPDDWGQFYFDTIAIWREAIKELPAEVAYALTRGNAENLWHLPPMK